ncbi:M43 family zinc metalloprotease [Pseudoalteromonas luteoviolacea]|uniref:M43 family zinc metalloprotease n=1 Tax=Pseudoalteromonas luteoviolacea TaxID=43657 RepID=UPI00068D52F5|nr:M43 family zinc metalloprotease [Pseudoalteromonas luteoviolacea]
MCNIKAIFFILSSFLLSACGGSGSSDTPGSSIPTPERYLVSTSFNDGGAITPLSFRTSGDGSKVFKVELEQGYELASISGCGGQLDGYNFSVEDIDKNCTIEATFTPLQYTVKVQTLTGGWVAQPSYQVVHGEKIDFTVHPNSDHYIESTTGCGGHLVDLKYTTGAVVADCTVTVAFKSHFPLPSEGIERIRLPVVVHVLENEYVEISDEQIMSQIEATNKHFRGMNYNELESIDEQFKPYIADTGIQLYLASHDPNGNPHSGINRKFANLSVISAEHAYAKSEKGGIDVWPTDQYLNVWVGYGRDFKGTLGLVGRANIPGLVEDRVIGVVVAHTAFGVIQPREPRFDEGKTLTHELGHLLGLIGHTHGMPTDKNTHSHLTCDGKPLTSCKNSDLSMSFMNSEVDDNGQRMFSISQRQVMVEWVTSGPLQPLYLNTQ